ncbi:MAG: 3',5'-cyclic-nucleotide phosphodiesterase [Acidovorax sp. SCN 65-108]|nr:MAG: 3',5'-cyclic-nucleotide phosphodiesterase [Acidovorax sp. SCN 65-108]OJV73971.1 MAG: 3',5'-cyclic-nucleotide phosphodiesterase [Burkholderiales bacterium 64-34]
MKVRVLGCSGAIAKDCRTTSFLIDDNILVDAGTGVGDLTLDEMRKIDHVFLTHSHLDHIAALPLMLDAVSSLRSSPVQVHALSGTINALQVHMFNNVIWPNFSAIPTVEQPFLRYSTISVGQQVTIGRRVIEVLPAVHTVPAVGYAVLGDIGWWVFSGDTERNAALWAWIDAMPVCQLIVETAFSNRESELAVKSLHLSPRTLEQELAQLRVYNRFPIYITHTKPFETALIMDEIRLFETASLAAGPGLHSIQWLQAGQVFDV